MVQLEKQANDDLLNKNTLQTISHYEQAIEVNPHLMSNYAHLGLAYLLQGQQTEAEAIWLTGISQGTSEEADLRKAELIEILISEASKQVEIFDYETALTIRLYIQKLEPHNINNLLGLAWLYIELNKFETEGQSALLQATQVLLNSAQAEKVNSDLLLRVLETVLEINPYDAFIEVGLKCPKLERENEEIKKITAKYRGLFIKLGIHLYQQKSFASAFKQLQKALNFKDNMAPHTQAEILYMQGLCCVSQNKTQAAIPLFEASLNLSPNFAQAASELQKNQYRLKTQLKGYQFTQDWFSRNIPGFQKNLERYVNIADIKALEIGSWEGRSTCWLLENILIHPSAEITCIDTFQGSIEHTTFFNQTYINSIESRFDFNIQLTQAGQKVKKIIGNSHEILRTLPLNTYDFIYIDGSHLACDVLADAVLSWPILKLGGLMIFDDYDFSVPNQPTQDTKIGIDAFLKAFQPKLKILQQEYQVMVEKIAH
ncbi:class I SAM-dependent methyltransferase [Ancylothrix sp. D3o]|uniref:class I SAM-dependent methyltransferase n=1 Tax=Ancylothrix sp. D3o TaxID=2953691 RepID=UPI0021BB707D|nr:class I SAM-dependent methyltransferase [Ancylothrix sp. D3o]